MQKSKKKVFCGNTEEMALTQSWRRTRKDFPEQAQLELCFEGWIGAHWEKEHSRWKEQQHHVWTPFISPAGLCSLVALAQCWPVTDAQHISLELALKTGLCRQEERNRGQSVGGCHLETVKTEITRLPKSRADGGQQQRPEKWGNASWADFLKNWVVLQGSSSAGKESNLWPKEVGWQ